MDNDLFAGSRVSHLEDEAMDAECLRLLVPHIGVEHARLALSDESYLPVLLPFLDSDGTDEDAVRGLREAFDRKPQAIRS